MRPIKPHFRRRPAWQKALLALGAIVIVGGVSIGSLAALKVINVSKWFGRSRPTYPADWIAVPLSTRPIPAYTRVTRDFLLDPKTGEPVLKWYSPQEARRHSELDIAKVLNRVTAHEVPAMYFFHESDFEPPGSPPGVIGGTPAGKRAFTLDASKLKGCVFDLKQGDHLDLLADIPIDKLYLFGGADAGRPTVTVMPISNVTQNGDKQRTETRVVARDAVVVSPVTTRNRPVVSNSLQGTTVRNVPVQEVVLAVGEEEIASVTKAIDWNLGILCAARSARPEAKEEAAPPPGPVSVPILVREVPAFMELSEADFRDPVTQHTRYGFASLAEVNRRGIVPNLSDLIGRVVKRHLLVGRMVTEEDLLPIGSPPGITGAIGPDRQAMGIDASKLPGIEDLRAGDRLDIVGSFDLEEKQEQKETERLADGTVRTIESHRSATRNTRLSSEASLGGRAEHWFVAIDAEVVVPLGTTVSVPTAAAAAVHEKPRSEVIVAVDRRDVPSVAQALASKGIVLTAVARPAGKGGAPAGKPVAPPGMLVVPAAPKGLPAFEPLTRESLRNTDTRREEWRVVDAKAAAGQRVVVDPEQLLGRILNKEKRQGEFFTDDDFLPAWVKPGIAARVPAGKRAIIVDFVEKQSEEKVERSIYSESKTTKTSERQKINNLELASDGAHFDILVSRPVQFGSSFVVHTGGSTLANRMRVRPIVHDAVLVYHNLKQAMIALDPGEVAPLEEALAGGAQLRAVIYSGQTQDTKGEPAVTAFDGTGGLSAIEMLVGEKQKFHVFQQAQ